MVHDYTKDTLPNYIPTTIWPNDQARIAALELEIKMIKEMLRRAEIYDEENNQPDCPMEDKIEAVKELCELLGVDPKELT
jgi:hypothetical protein